MSTFRSPNSQVDSEVTTLELRAFSTTISQAVSSLRLNDDTNQPLRPAFGTQGSQIMLLANYFQLSEAKGAKITFHWYSISIIEQEEGQRPKGKKLARLIKLFIEEHLQENFLVVSDYSSIIMLTEKHPGEQQEFSVTYREEGSQTPGEEQRKTYRMQLQYTRSLDSHRLLAHLRNLDFNRPELPDKQEIIQAMNVIIGYGLKGATNTIMSRSNKYIPFAGQSVDQNLLGSGVEMFRGYTFSIRPATGRILLNAQVKHQAFYIPQDLPTLFRALSVNENSNEDVLRAAEYIIKGAKVKLTQFQPERNKTVLGFATPGDGVRLEHPPRVPRYGATAANVQFWDAKGKKYISVNEHFHKTHNMKSRLPVINTGSRADPVYTIAEFCRIPQGVPFRARLKGDQSSRMIQCAVRAPHENATSVTNKGVKLLQDYSMDSLETFGWNMNKALVKIHGRVLDAPKLTYAKKNSITVQNGSWNMTNNAFVQGQQLPRFWAVVWVTLGSGRGINTGGVKNLAELDSFVMDFGEALGRCGIRNSERINTRELNIPSEAACKEAILNRFRLAAGANIGLLLFVLPKASVPIYNAIKQAGDITHGIHTICVVGTKFCKTRNEQYFANIALKFNLKLGGRNQELKATDLGFISRGTTMLVGIDVTHPAPGEDKAPSVACIVASVDQHCAQWPAHIRVQPRREEMVQVLKEMFKNRLQYWQKRHKTLPEQILVYRDGVGEGQYGLVRDHELSEIREACKELYTGDQQKAGLPRITIVIVGKRHNTRFFPVDERQGYRGNPKNGTVVDRGVTEARIWDFYLQAHTAVKGTAKPAHYVVVHDEIFRRAAAARADFNDRRSAGQRAADSLESITHNLCYLYGRATKAVSICPPAYYADIACERARRWLSRLYTDYSLNAADAGQATTQEVTVHPQLENTMFYI